MIILLLLIPYYYHAENMLNDPIRNETIKKRFILTTKLLLLFVFGFAHTCHAEDSDLAGQYYERAVMEYHNDNIKEAIIELKNATQQNPDYLAAQILLAEVYLQDKNLIATEVALSQADKLGADPALLVKTRAQLNLYQLKYSQLLKEIQAERFVRNLRPDLYIYRGHAYLQLNEPKLAMKEYEAAEQLEPNRIEPLIGRANVFLQLGKIEAARQVAEQAAKLQPDSADSWYIKAAINHTLGHLQEAMTQYIQAVKLDPQHYDARVAKAGILMDLGRDDEAKADLQFLRESHPFDAKIAYLHAVVLARSHRQKEAVLELTAAADALDSVEPEFLTKHAQSLMLGGLVNYSINRFDRAMYFLKIYIQKYPQQPAPYKLMAAILLNRGENGRVIKLLRPILAIVPNDHRLLFLLGSAYMQDGQHDLANMMLEKAAEMNVQGLDIGTELGLNRLAMGQEDLAIAKLEDAVKTNPGNTKAGIPLTIMYLKQGEPDQANRVAKAMHGQAPENLTLLNLLATTQVAIGEKKMARESFNQAIKKDPGFITAHINLSKLDSIENKTDVAKARINGLLVQYPTNIALLIELARVYEAESDYDSASDWLEKAHKVDSKSIAATVALIKLKLKTARYPEALNLAIKAQSHERENMQLLELLARSFIANNNNSKAAGVLQNMSRYAGFNAKKLYQIAQQQFAVADYQSAISSLKNAVLGNEHYIPARVALAEAELQYGKAVFARNHAKFLVKHYPEQSYGYRLLGDIAQKKGKSAKAVQHYQAAFENNRNSFLLMKLYSSLKQSGENQQAFQLVQQWVEKHQQDAVPVQALAEEYLHHGRFKQAQKYYEQLVQRFNKRPDLLNNLAFIYFNIGDDKALNYAQQAQQLAPKHPAANDTLGWILVNRGQPERALHYLRTAHARSSQDPEIRYHIAVALHQLQRYAEAKTELKQALKARSGFNGSADAKKLLEKMSD